MAIRSIRVDDDPILRKVSRPVVKFDPLLHSFLNDMEETMRSASGVGLAAPQVGTLKRVFIIDIGEGLVEFINPIIIFEDGEQTGDEGCLSVPGRYGVVTRPNTVTIKAQDRYGNHFEITKSELFARAICHENDHLDGKIFVDCVIGDLHYSTGDEHEEEY
ncbi:peptide deformylase [Candidatus Epulonipiscium viviparus]|uniref:peptide deformylase n=1 Tax=Candidatus Epulonipiscium viviparus TaxID=420336 RepID=UPI00016C01EB|nr:peptide deformylase [Candidatus Epulopiscium viviparus]